MDEWPAGSPVAGPELDDLARQSAADAMLAILAKLGGCDVGCDEAMAVLHICVDLVAAGQDAAERYPGVAVHVRACGPCDDDFAGLLTAVTSG